MNPNLMLRGQGKILKQRHRQLDRKAVTVFLENQELLLEKVSYGHSCDSTYTIL